MKHFKGNKAIGTLFAFPSILLAVAMFTITNSFAMPDQVKSVKRWEVSFKDVVTNKDDGKVIISNDKIDINVILNESKEIYTITTSIENNGSFDALLNRIDMTDLGNIKIGTSDETGITYYLSDYVTVSAKYASDNKINGILAGNTINIGDRLDKHTKNGVVIAVQYKDITTLSQDALVVLNQNVKEQDGKMPLKFSMSVGLNYIENIK